MLKQHRLLVVLIGQLLLSSGCSNMTMLRTKELRAVQANVDTLRVELVTLQKAMYEEQKVQTEIVRLIRADQQIKFAEIDRKVSEVAMNLDENQNRLSRINENTAAFQKKFEAKLTSDSVLNNERDKEVQNLFQTCMSDFNAGRFDIARTGFSNLATQYPDARLAPDAEYWVAECQYAKHSYDDAIKEYIAYIKKYPEGDKLCVSLYKLGLAYGKQKKDASKKMVWKKALEQCPDAPEIQMIKNDK